MRYVSNLIPKASKVLPDYFQGKPYYAKQTNKILAALGWVSGAFFLLGALASIEHPLLALVFGLLGFIILPYGHRWLEKKARFRFETKPKAIIASVLLLISFPLAGHYAEVKKVAAYQQKLLSEKEERDRLVAEKKDNHRRDSLNYYLQSSEQLQAKHRTEDASQALNRALLFAATMGDKSDIEKQKTHIASQKTLDLVNAGKYKEALPELNALLAQNSEDVNLLYNRALCYSKVGKTAEAVADCKKAMEDENIAAEKLYDKINPVRRRVAYYVTRCCDGTTSDAKGRGACSHHGGVCDWNDPVYEEYRTYE